MTKQRKTKLVEAKTEIDQFSEQTDGDIYTASIRREYGYHGVWAFLKWTAISGVVSWLGWNFYFYDGVLAVIAPLVIGFLVGMNKKLEGFWHRIEINDTQFIINKKAYALEHLKMFCAYEKVPWYNLYASYGDDECEILIERNLFEVDLLRQKLNAEIAKRTDKVEPVNVPENPETMGRAAGF
ncbi:MAG: hypothetical protein AAFW83_10875 [Pseudomonadota bacterium]